MKTVLAFAAIMGLSISAAAAACAGHAKVTASVDTETTVASVVKETPLVMEGQTATTEQDKKAE